MIPWIPDGTKNVSGFKWTISQHETRGIKDHADIVIGELRAAGGFIDVTDKSSPELIQEIFGISKKSFKKAFW